MAKITSYTKEYIDAIERRVIVGGQVSGDGSLKLVNGLGEEIDAGNVQGDLPDRIQDIDDRLASEEFKQTQIPKSPTMLTELQNEGFYSSSGPMAKIILGWIAPELDIYDQPMEVSEYQVYVNGAPEYRVNEPRVSFELRTDDEVEVYVVGGSKYGLWSDPSEVVQITGAKPDYDSATPTRPVLSFSLGVLAARWDGLYVEGVSPANSYITVHVRVNGGPEFIAGSLEVDQPMIIPEIKAGDECEVWFVAFDKLGRETGTSISTTETVTGVGSVDLDQAITNFLSEIDTKSNNAWDAASVAVKDTTIEYAVGSSETVAPVTGWSTTTPVRSPGTFIWMRSVITFGNDSTSTTSPVLVTGNDGAKGDPGAPGTDGRGIVSTEIRYQAGSSGTTAPTGTWQSSVPTVSAGQYLWTRTTVTYTSGTPSVSYSVGRMGTNGSNGAPGAPGADGQTSYLHVAYANSADGTANFSTSDPSGRAYMGTYTDFTIADSTTPGDYTWSLIKGADGSTGPAGKGIDSTVIHYAQSTSGTEAPSSGWQTTIPSVPEGQYLWTRTRITFTDSAQTDTFTVAKQGAKGDTGAPGADGSDGADGRGIVSTEIRYQASSSGTTAPTGTWNTSVPSVPAGQYLWTRTVVNYTSGSPSTSYSVGRMGTNGSNGTPGAPGADGQTSYFHVAYASNPTGTSNFSTTDPTGRTYVGTYTDFVEADSTNPADYTWALFKGADGTPGKGISSTVVNYASHTSGTTPPTTGWGTSIPAVAEGSYLWTRTVITFTDSATTTSYTAAKQGAKGATGAPGADGRSVTSVDVMYYLSTSATTQTGGSWVTNPPAWIDGRYMWTKTVVTYSTGSPSETDPVNITGAKGATGSTGSPGAPGVGISSTVINYASHTSGTSAPSTGWQTAIPTVAQGNFLWTRTVITYTDSSTSTAYTVARMGANGSAGAPGAPGADGVDGRGVVSIVEEYYLSTSSTSQTGGSWGTSVPAWVDGRFYWTRSKITYTDSSVVTTTPVNVTGGKGATGAPGVGITGTVVNYAVGSSGTTAPSSGWGTSIPSVGAGQYLWTRTVTSYSSGSPTTAYSVGLMGQNGAAGATGKGVSSTEVRYQLHSNGTTAPTGTWQTSPQTQTEALPYLWTRTITTYTDSTTSTAYSVGVRGAKGSTGDTGPQGVSVSSVQQYYQTTAASASAPAVPTTSTPPSPWTTTEPAYAANTALWVTTRVGYSNSTFSYTPVSKVSAFTAASQAQTTADGKNRVWYSNTAPSGTGHKVDDVWFDGANGNRINTWSGSAWVVRQMGTNAIANLAITNGLIANATIQDAKIATLDAAKITTGELSASRVKMDTAFINKMAANKILVSGDNLIKNTDFMGGGWTKTNGQNSVNFAPVTGPSGKPAVVGEASGATVYAAYYAGTNSHNPDWVIPVSGAEEFRATVWVYSATAIPANKVGVGIVRYTETYARSTASVTFPSSIPANTWSQISVTLTSASNTRSIGLYFPVSNGHSSDIYYSDPELVRKATGELIVDGAITGEKITVNSAFITKITADEVLSGRIKTSHITDDGSGLQLQSTSGTVTITAESYNNTQDSVASLSGLVPILNDNIEATQTLVESHEEQLNGEGTGLVTQLNDTNSIVSSTVDNVSSLTTTVGNASSGLVKTTNDIVQALNEQQISFVVTPTDVQVKPKVGENRIRMTSERIEIVQSSGVASYWQGNSFYVQGDLISKALILEEHTFKRYGAGRTIVTENG